MARKKRKGPNIGLSVSQDCLEIVVFDPKGFAIQRSHRIPIPEGVITHHGDWIADLNQLVSIIKNSVGSMKPRPKEVNLSMTGTLLRMLEMPKMESRELYISLSSEAERYKPFDDTEAIVDFHLLPQLPGSQGGMQRVVFGAVRKDTFDTLRRALQIAKIKVASVDIEPLNILRAMAGTGVLDSLVQQIGDDSYWGTVFVEAERVRFSLWQANELIELREVSMDTTDFANADPDSPYIFDLVDEIRRTSKSTIPALWLTHNMPDAISEGLAQQLGVPVRPCLTGPGLALDRSDVRLDAIGAAMVPQVEFPFDFNFLTGAAESAVMGKGAAEVVSHEDEGAGPTLLIAGGVLATIFALIVWGGMVLFEHLFLGSQLAELQQKQTQLTAQVAVLNNEMQSLKTKYDMRARIVDIVEKAEVRNAVYLNLVRDLQRITPENIWLYNIEVGDSLKLEGKSLTHQAVIHFAKRFDSLLYAKAVLIDSIREELADSQKVFRFRITGNTRFDPVIIRQGKGTLEGKPVSSADGSGSPPAQSPLNELEELE